jgi:spore coat-associated protein N
MATRRWAVNQSRQLIRRPKRTLGALALGLCAIGVAVGSGADFTARTANPSNTFSAGSLSMDNSKNGAAIFSPTNMKPGGAAQTGVVDIKNTGSIDGVFTLSRDQLTSSDSGAANPVPFANKVDLWVVDCGKNSVADGAPTCGDANDSTLYNGTLANQNAALELGTYHPGDQHRYWFGGSLDPSAGNEYADDGSSARYVFDAVQTP